MKSIFISIILFLLLVGGCQKNDIFTEEVINEHGAIKNIEGLNTFVNKVHSNKTANIWVVSYGIEGQRFVEKLTYNGENINVHRSADKDFIEEYQCENIFVGENEVEKRYILKQCTGNFTGDSVLLTLKK